MMKIEFHSSVQACDVQSGQDTTSNSSSAAATYLGVILVWG